MLTEFGGISYRPQSSTSWFGYGTVTNPDAFLSKYRELLDAILESPAIAGFCYTQLTDTAQESNGLLTANREPKFDMVAVRSVTERLTASVPGDVIVQMSNAHDITPFARAD